MTELSDLFKLVAEEKRKKKDEIDSLIGDSFEKLFVEQLKSNNKQKKKKDPVEVLEKKLLSLEDISYSSIDELMKSICSEYDISTKKLHNDFVEKHNVIPDEWIKNRRKVDERIEEPEESEIIKEKVITEGLLNIPPQEKTPDPLTPLDQKFATLDDLQKHYNLFLSRIQQQLSTLGGGGETNLAYMDMPLKYVTSSSYIIKPQDYYIGVNYAGSVTITLPTPRKDGKVYIVKDELGEASKGTNRYITILPSGSDLIDGRDRAIIAYDFGSLTFVYRNGWRVV